MFLIFRDGSSNSIRNSVVNLEEIQFGSRFTYELPIKNSSSNTISVLGAKSSCGCVAIVTARYVLPTNVEVKIPVKISASKLGKFDHMIELFVDAPQQRVEVRFFGTVVEVAKKGSTNEKIH